MTDDPEGARRKRVTIYDIARAAGVAPSTVSRTFARPGRVNQDTAEHIRRVAAELGYRTKAIRTGEPGTATQVLGMSIADAANPVFAHILRGFEAEAELHGFAVVAIDTRESAEVEREHITRISPFVDGLSLAASRLSDQAILQLAKVRPVVSVNRVVSGLTSVIADTGRGMRRVVEHLASLGHVSFAYLSGPPASWADGMRWRAISEACHELQLSIRRVKAYPPTLDGGVSAQHDWESSPTTAVIAYNDLMAIGFMHAAQRSGWNIPADISVVGIDNSISSVITTPKLSSVAPLLHDLGSRAARALVNQLRHRSSSRVERIVVPMHAYFRDSIAPAGTRTTRRKAQR